MSEEKEKDIVQEAIEKAKAAAERKKARNEWRRRVNKRNGREHWTERDD